MQKRVVVGVFVFLVIGLFMISLVSAVDSNLPSLDSGKNDSVFVQRVYEFMLEREPETVPSPGANHWISLLASGTSRYDVVYGFYISDEFKGKYVNNLNIANNSDFINFLYQKLLDRNPEPAGVAYWLPKLNAGVSRNEVALGVIRSIEFGNHFSSWVYFNPNPTPNPGPNPMPGNTSSTNSTQTGTCVDSDGGFNIYVKGKTTGPVVGQNRTDAEEDFCSQYDSNSLQEFTCGHMPYNSSVIGLIQTGVNCPNGCSDGACVQVINNGTTNVVFDSNTYSYFMVSWLNGTSSVYDTFSVSAFATNNDQNQTTLKNNNTGVTYEVQSGSVMHVGDSEFSIGAINRIAKTIELIPGLNVRILLISIEPSSFGCTGNYCFICEGKGIAYADNNNIDHNISINFVSADHVKLNFDSSITNSLTFASPFYTRGAIQIKLMDIIYNSKDTGVSCISFDVFEAPFFDCGGGCTLNNKCVSVGYRANEQYCGLGGNFTTYTNVNGACANNFECSSNVCAAGKCVDAGLFQKILDWFKSIFGAG